MTNAARAGRTHRRWTAVEDADPGSDPGQDPGSDGAGAEPVPEPVPTPDAVAPDAVAPDAAPAAAAPGEQVLAGPGIDPTGVVVSTTAVLAWFAALPAGSSVVVRGGDVIALDATIRLTRRVDIRGGGELRFVGGIPAASAVKVIAAGSSIRGIRITNTGPIDAGAGERNVGIDIHADDVVIDGVTVDGFQNGIVDRPFGEYEGAVVTNCHVVNIVGAGGGRGSSSAAGEDRGDGITIWGARAVVIGNVVSAAPGTDARVGIHAESLPDYAVDPGAWADSMVTIEGNVVTGPFRRSIAVEGMGHTVVSGNTVSDATWWGIAAIDTRAVAIVGNTVRWTREEADTQGAAWRPARSPIMVYRDAQGTLITGNTIEVRGVAACAIMLQSASRPGDTDAPIGAVDAIVTDNIVRIAGGSCPVGVTLDRTQQAVVANNRITVTLASGTVGGIMSYLSVGSLISDNSVTGAAATNGFGVRHEGSASVVITGNQIDRIRVAVAVIHCAEGSTIAANTGRDCEFGLDTYGSTGRSVVYGNRWDSTNTAHTNAQPNTSYLSTRHMGLARPYGGLSGDILIGNGLLWVNDRGAWRSVALT